MKVIDDGHVYKLDSLDGQTEFNLLVFVKRTGEKYPGNTNSHAGTIIQDVLRCCIDRIKYVDNQIHDDLNDQVLYGLRLALHSLELRAAHRHKTNLKISTKEIENMPTGLNGHLLVGAGSAI